MSTTTTKLTAEQRELLADLDEGADIFGRRDAELLRQLDEEQPGLVELTKPMGTYRGDEQLPFFGAILTAQGRDFLAETAEA